MQDLHSPILSRLVYSLDAFLDHERSFQEFLVQQGMQSAMVNSGLRLRNTHKVHAKACTANCIVVHTIKNFLQRYGVPMELPDKKLPEVSKEEFYNTCKSWS